MAKNYKFWEEELENCKANRDCEGFVYALEMLAFLQREEANVAVKA